MEFYVMDGRGRVLVEATSRDEAQGMLGCLRRARYVVDDMGRILETKARIPPARESQAA